MAERAPTGSNLREHERRQIELQVQEFLDNGGKIEQIPWPQNNNEQRVWRPSHIEVFEGL